MDMIRKELIKRWRERASDARLRAMDVTASQDERNQQIGMAAIWTSCANELEGSSCDVDDRGNSSR